MKTMSLRYPLNLQFFAEGNGDPTPPGPNPPAAGDPPATPPTPPAPPAAPSNGQGSLTLESVQKFVSENEDGKKWLQSLSDSRVTDAIKTYETKTLPKKLEDEIAKRYPPETEDQKALRELKQRFEESERQRTHEALKTKALTAATAKGVPADIIDLVIGKDEESTTGNIDKISAAFNAYAQKVVDQKFKESGKTPPASGGADKSQLTREQLNNMSPQDIVKAMSEGRADNLLKGSN